MLCSEILLPTSQATPKGFIFHFKVFQLFTAQQVDDVHKLPVSVKAQLPEALLKRNGPILLKELDEDLVESIWYENDYKLDVGHLHHF